MYSNDNERQAITPYVHTKKKYTATNKTYQINSSREDCDFDVNLASGLAE